MKNLIRHPQDGFVRFLATLGMTSCRSHNFASRVASRGKVLQRSRPKGVRTSVAGGVCPGLAGHQIPSPTPGLNGSPLPVVQSLCYCAFETFKISSRKPAHKLYGATYGLLFVANPRQ